ncbi:hypothetical protein ACFQ6Q_25440 [Streptomyces sp. NPDC056437]|uniref:hypothetical protein n=1 Tax=Streptomyces sp. NPDC056437 TaxID=3345816 RepID=UPI00367DCC21
MRRRPGTALVAVALCLGGTLTACGSGGGDGYAAVGAAGSGPERGPTAAVPPKGDVVLVPLDGTTGSGEPPGATPPKGGQPSGTPSAGGGSGAGGTGEGSGSSGAPGSSGSPGAGGPASGSPAEAGSGTSGGSGTPGSSGGTDTPGRPGTPPAEPPSKPTPKPPPGPAVLSVGEPVRAALDRRWCEQVTVTFRNTGQSPVASGTVTFATHIIGALGIDWATIRSSQPLPVPIAAGAARAQAYTVCVDAWRVPLGMHIETQDVTATWT